MSEELEKLRFERDQAISEHGQQSGFWGRMAARCVAERNRERKEVERLQVARIGDSEHIGHLLSVIESLKRGSCWCSVAPRKASESHSSACVQAAKAIGQAL